MCNRLNFTLDKTIFGSNSKITYDFPPELVIITIILMVLMNW